MRSVTGTIQQVWIVWVAGSSHYDGVFSTEHEAKLFKNDEPFRVIKKQYGLVMRDPDVRVLLLESPEAYLLQGDHWEACHGETPEECS